MGPEAKDTEWLSEAFSGSVSALLGNVESLETKAPPTKAEFDSVQGNVDKIEAAFKVKFYVQPSVIVASEQLAAALEAHRLDALYLYGGINAANDLFALGRSAEALPCLDEVLGIEPSQAPGLLAESFVLADLGRLAEARDALNRVQGQIAEGSLTAPWAVSAQYVLALEQGDSRAAAPLLQKTLKTFEDPQASSQAIEVVTQILLPFLARHGQLETALHILTCDVETGLNPVYDQLVLDPRLEPLRRDDRFKPIFDKARQDFEDMIKVLEQARSRGELPRYLEAPLADLIKKPNLQDIR